MELVFFWGEKYRNIENESFNFNPVFKFSFCHKKNKLEFKKIDVLNIFNDARNISNVTAIIGKNGSGKTTFMNALMDCYWVRTGEGQWNKEYIMVFYKETGEKEDQLGCFHIYSNIDKLNNLENTKYGFINKNEVYSALDSSEELVKKTGMIHYSNAFNGFEYKNGKRESYGNFFNIDMMHEIRKAAKVKREMQEIGIGNDPIVAFLEDETKKQLTIFTDNEQKRIIPFQVTNLYIHKINYSYMLEQYGYEQNKIEEWKKKFNNWIVQIRQTDDKKKVFLINFLKDISQDETNKKVKEKIEIFKIEIINLIHDENNKLDENLLENKFEQLLQEIGVKSRINSMFSTIKNLEFQQESRNAVCFCIEVIMHSLVRWIIPSTVGSGQAKEHYKLKKKLVEWEQEIEKFRSDINNEKYLNINSISSMLLELVKKTLAERFSCEQERELFNGYEDVIKFLLKSKIDSYDNERDGYIIDIKSEIEEVIQFYEAYQKTTYHVINYLEFEWGMSSGELAYFSLYARFYSLKKQIGPEVESLVVLIDEADLYFHPKWQQEFVKRVLNMLSIIYEEKKIQLIIATHSPIFLSDIPQGHIIYLGNEKIEQQTFAANIYNLYNSSFFFEENKNMGIIGDFANEKIKLVKNALHVLHDEITFVEWIEKAGKFILDSWTKEKIFPIGKETYGEKKAKQKRIINEIKKTFLCCSNYLLDFDDKKKKRNENINQYPNDNIHKEIVKIANTFSEKLVQENVKLKNICDFIENNKDVLLGFLYERQNSKETLRAMIEYQQIINIIGEKVIQNSLMELYDSVENKISKPYEDNSGIQAIVEDFEHLTSEQQKIFIKAIIKKNKISGENK